MHTVMHKLVDAALPVQEFVFGIGIASCHVVVQIAVAQVSEDDMLYAWKMLLPCRVGGFHEFRHQVNGYRHIVLDAFSECLFCQWYACAPESGRESFRERVGQNG